MSYLDLAKYTVVNNRTFFELRDTWGMGWLGRGEENDGNPPKGTHVIRLWFVNLIQAVQFSALFDGGAQADVWLAKPVSELWDSGVTLCVRIYPKPEPKLFTPMAGEPLTAEEGGVRPSLDIIRKSFAKYDENETLSAEMVAEKLTDQLGFVVTVTDVEQHRAELARSRTEIEILAEQVDETGDPYAGV